MTEINASRERILDAAERRARRGGYNGFSFRDLASDVGVKSSSVHYHFPTKADLAEALTTRYAAKALETLGAPEAIDGREAIAKVGALFRGALTEQDAMCLCGVFGAERDALPEGVDAAVARYFRRLLAYLETAFGPDWTGPTPAAVLARLEGALILARVLRDPGVFESAVAGIDA
ncbi:MAG: TetR/AcrR family transcriptional regulator [Pseudomonadota bacterium]